MSTFSLPARRRTAIGKSVKSLRRNHLVPAVLYGHGLQNQNLEVDTSALQKILRHAGSSSLVDLVIDQQAPVQVLIHAIQRHPTLHAVRHVDFYQVKMTEKLETDIELHFEGESPAVKEQGGILVRATDKIRVSCLPADLVPNFPVDISRLQSFDDQIKIRDLVIPATITVLEDPEAIVATVTPPRSQAELEALDTTVTEDVGTVEKVEKPKEEAGEESEESPDASETKPEAKEK